MYRHVHRQLMRNELPNFITIVPVTAYYHRSYVETYSRCIEDPQDEVENAMIAELARGSALGHGEVR